jgi:predicted ArsR family transcriptional regulator
MATTAPLARNVECVPTDLRSTSTKLVYLYLDVAGEATVSEMAETLGMQKLALFSILDTLESKGHVEGDGTTFAAAG